MIYQAGLLIITSYERHQIERAAGSLVARLSYVSVVNLSEENGCVVELVGIANGVARYRVYMNGVRGRVERYVLWPAKP